jgi:hypothetical protein
MATYPSQIASFSTKIDNITTIVASDPNLIQAEVVATQTELGTNARVSVLGTGGLPSYIASPNSSSFSNVKARIANIEAGLTTALSGMYTQLSTGTISGTAGSPTSYNVTSTGYRKLVFVISIGTVNGCTNAVFTINGINSGGLYNYSYIRHSTGNWISSVAGNGIFISSGLAPVANETIVIEITEPAISGYKAISFSGRNGLGQGGILTSGMGSPITTWELQFTTGVPASSTYTVYGVK